MSTRNIRKLAERIQHASPKNDEQVECEDFSPLYVKAPGPSYAGLRLSSSSSEDSASEQKEKNDEEASTSEEARKPKKKNKNNRKNKNKNKRKQSIANDSSANSENDVDEIASIVAEVNQLLGSPVIPEQTPEAPAPPDVSRTLMKIENKHLNPNNELNRLFGPDEGEERRKRRTGRYNTRVGRQIVMQPENYNFSIKGLGMKLVEIKDGVKYFKFQHGPEYSKNMRILVEALKAHHGNYIMHIQDHEVFPSNTVEGLVENLDLYFHLEEPSHAFQALEQSIFFMQSTFDHLFNFLDGKTRLEYKYVENRVLHIALLKYLHIQTNKACHRTALELCKLMLNLDPSDPLGVIFIMDTLALRAREHKWLVDIYNHWSHEKDTNRLFNVQYSHALAMYHLYLKSKNQEDLLEANSLMMNALAMYPNVVVMLMGHCNQHNPEIMNHEVFTTNPNSTTSHGLLNLQQLYAKFVWPKWREPNIMEWVIENALHFLALYQKDPAIKAKVLKGAQDRFRLFRKYPLEIKRHFHTITSMSNLLVDGAVPAVDTTISCNPYPNQGVQIDQNGYFRTWGASIPDTGNVLQNFLASLVPEMGNRGPENREGAGVAHAPPNERAEATNEGACNPDDNDVETPSPEGAQGNNADSSQSDTEYDEYILYTAYERALNRIYEF